MGKYILITGSTDGVGFVCAQEFAKLGKNLIIHGRNHKKLEQTRENLLSFNSSIQVKTVLADFEDLEQVKDAFCQIKDYPIETLINNAGTFSKTDRRTRDGFEATYQVNHLAHFLIVQILKKTIINNAPSKIIVVSSMAHSNSVDFEKLQVSKFPFGYEGYAQSKLCNILFAFRMAKELKNKGVSVNCLHPGVINTKLLVENWGACGINVKDAHKMIMFAYNLPNTVNGEYLRDFRIARAADIAYDTDIQDRCYKISQKHTQNFLKSIKNCD